MLLRFTLSAAGAVMLASTAAAQQPGNLQAKPITSPVRDAGTFNMATGQWTRTGNAAFDASVPVYDNTCEVGFYTGLGLGLATVDSGRIPSLSDNGIVDCYTIDCFQFGYCSFQDPNGANAGQEAFVLAWFNCYDACAAAVTTGTATPVQAFLITNLPGGGTGSTQGCWLITFNLANTTVTFDLDGDGNGNFDNVASTDHFAWWFEPQQTPTGSDAGPIIAGDPLQLLPTSAGQCAGAGTGTEGEGTSHPGYGPSTGAGTGIGQLAYQGLGVAPLSGCFWFGGSYSNGGGNPLAAFYHKLWAGATGVNCIGCASTSDNQGTGYCSGDGTSGTSCPGFTVGAAGAGCPHGAGPNGASGSLIVPTGNAQFSNDTYGFYLSQGPSSLGILIQGANPNSYPGGNPNLPDSAGLLCVNPQQRGFVETTPLGAGSDEAQIDDFQGQPFGATAQAAGSTTYNQFWHRDNMNPNANPGPNVEFNFSNGVETNWIN